jgi:Coiled-coil domain-containing protein 124 /Oxs1
MSNKQKRLEQRANAQAEKLSAEQAKREKELDAEWSVGVSKKEAAEKKKAADLQEKERKRLEKERIEKQEAEEASKMKKIRGSEKVALKKAIEAESESYARIQMKSQGLVATGIENAINLLSVASGTAQTAVAYAEAKHGKDVDELMLHQSAIEAMKSHKTLALDDEHPEKRMKAAYAAWSEKRLPRLREENPGLRHSQLQELMFKEWGKSDENPLVVYQKRKELAESEAKKMLRQ